MTESELEVIASNVAEIAETVKYAVPLDVELVLERDIPSLITEVRRLRGALAGLVGCIATSANEPEHSHPSLRGESEMKQVCRVITKTVQFDDARKALRGDRRYGDAAD